MNASTLAFARDLADPDWSLSVPKVAKDVIGQLVAEVEALTPRTITTAEELDDLPFGSAVQTSDASDTVVLKAEGGFFRNQSGFEVSVPVLWQFGTKPFTVLYEPALS